MSRKHITNIDPDDETPIASTDDEKLIKQASQGRANWKK